MSVAYSELNTYPKDTRLLQLHDIKLGSFPDDDSEWTQQVLA